MDVVTLAAAKAAAVSNKRLLMSVLAGGRTVAFEGDSIFYGTGSTNASTTSMRAMAVKIAGSAYVKDYNGGVAGETSAQLLSRFSTDLTTAGANAVIIQIGTNDAGGAVSLATTAANITAMVNKCRASGLPVAICLIPPRGASATAAVKLATARINLWLRLWAPPQGVPLVDVCGLMVDPLTGDMLASYTTDDVHPLDAGHLAAGQAIGPVVRDLGRTGTQGLPPWPVYGPTNARGFGLLVNPLVNTTANWSGVATGSPTSVTADAPSGSDLPRGNWLSIRNNNSGGGSSVTSQRGATIDATKWVAGDVLMVCFYAKTTAAGGTGLKVQILDQANASLGVLLDTPGVTNPGPVFTRFVVPAGATAMRLTLSASTLAGADTTASIGAADVFNLTSAGLTSLLA